MAKKNNRRVPYQSRTRTSSPTEMKADKKAVYLSVEYGRHGGKVNVRRLYKVTNNGIYYIDVTRGKFGKITSLYPLNNVQVSTAKEFAAELKVLIGNL